MLASTHRFNYPQFSALRWAHIICRIPGIPANKVNHRCSNLQFSGAPPSEPNLSWAPHVSQPQHVYLLHLWASEWSCLKESSGFWQKPELMFKWVQAAFWGLAEASCVGRCWSPSCRASNSLFDFGWWVRARKVAPIFCPWPTNLILLSSADWVFSEVVCWPYSSSTCILDAAMHVTDNYWVIIGCPLRATWRSLP